MAANFPRILGNKRDCKVSGKPQLLHESRLSVSAKGIRDDPPNRTFVLWMLVDNVHPPIVRQARRLANRGNRSNPQTSVIERSNFSRPSESLQAQSLLNLARGGQV